MPHITLLDILQVLAVLIGTVVFILVVRARQRGKAAHDVDYAQENVCEHLRPALELLRARGHRVDQVGQLGNEFPLEIHLRPPFDPQAVYDELKLEPPVYVSERNVLYCKEDWCEIHPVK
jgi:hypothetical protein